MNLDEAIKHAEEKAVWDCRCSKEHAQLALWLKELLAYRVKEAEAEEDH